MWRTWRIGRRREVILTDYWTWPERNSRFNGGGYLYGARPYTEISVGPLRFRHYIG